MTAISTRPPTGRVPWPLILIEGPEKSGKSWSAAMLSTSERVGQTYWLDIGEGAADEYGAIERARYLVVEHDGTWAQIIAQVRAIREEAARAAAAGEPPVVLVIDSMSAEWELLKEWTTNRAATSDSNKARLARDPNAEVKVPVNLWNDANGRHRRLMTLLITFPGIVVMTARGKEVVAMDDNGRPIEGSKDYKVEGHKTLAYDAAVWIRLSRDSEPQVIAARSVHAGIRPGRDKPEPLPEDWTLEGLIFNVLRCNQATSHTRQYTPTRAGDESPDLDDLSEPAKELLRDAEDASDMESLAVVWKTITEVGKAGGITRPEADAVRARIQQLKAEMQRMSEAA